MKADLSLMGCAWDGVWGFAPMEVRTVPSMFGVSSFSECQGFPAISRLV